MWRADAPNVKKREEEREDGMVNEWMRDAFG